MSFQSRYEAYLRDLCGALGHKNRHGSFQSYCSALMLPLERKSVEPMAASMDPERVPALHQSLHHFVSTSPWSDRKMLHEINQKVIAAMGDEPVYWLIDDSGMPKKGNHSVGVSRQYCGQLGKQANCQVAVSLSLANESASVPMDYQLYLPKAWCEDAERRGRVGVPEHIEFQTKNQIALAQIHAARERDVPCGIVVADAGYGNDCDLRDELDERGYEYMVGIQSSTTIWAPGVDPLPPKPCSGRGRPTSRMRMGEGHEPVQAQLLATEQLAPQAWREVKWREGTNEMLSSRFARVRVRVAHRDHLRAERRAEQWLLIEWPKNETLPTKYFLSNLPASTSLSSLVHTAKMRWRIERDYQELKQQFGLNQYEGRSWRGFHPHATLCTAAYAFLTIERLRHPARKKNRYQSAKPSLPDTYIPRGSPTHAETR